MRDRDEHAEFRPVLPHPAAGPEIQPGLPLITGRVIDNRFSGIIGAEIGAGAAPYGR